jgi:hypothetical protein
MKAPRKRPGRPGLGPVVTVSIRLPVPHYDALYRQARVARCSLAEYARRVLTRRASLES